ncbi:hypothetical protein N7460_009887 [Penicillium canescens]|uniref:Uncharacterized protein n=1 Tax=Penicillium canescens TaxID=5083 RepID=A0AAD6I8G9_PENCN|nr:hypothetical protein N7460_009887 [Penicillium canescens]
MKGIFRNNAPGVISSLLCILIAFVLIRLELLTHTPDSQRRREDAAGESVSSWVSLSKLTVLISAKNREDDAGP